MTLPGTARKTVLVEVEVTSEMMQVAQNRATGKNDLETHLLDQILVEFDWVVSDA